MADKELTRKIGKAIVVVTTPDVCKAPTVPTPYVSYSTFDMSVMTADTVRMTSCVSFTKESRLSMTMADQAGVGGGLKSQVFGGMCRPFKAWSSTVRAQGSEICRHDVIMEVNCAGPEGPGNTYGKVIYIECLSCASITEQGEIVIDDQSESQTSAEADDSSSSKEGSSADGPKQEGDPGGFTEEAGERIQGEIDGLKQAGQDVYDLATDPEARQAALDAVQETAEAASKDPVGFGKAAGGAILDDITEPFGTAGNQLGKGDYGGAAASAGYGILNVFNPLKKLKILQKVGKLGKVLKKKPKKKPNKKKKKKSEENDQQGEDGGTVKKPKVSFSDKQIQKKYKHADDFGVDGNYSKANGEKFKDALNNHVQSPDTQPITGTYRGSPAIIHTNPNNGLAVITKPDGTFVSGWKLNSQQLDNVMSSGSLGGG